MTLNLKWAGSKESFHEFETSMKAIKDASADIKKQAQDWEEEQDDLEDEHDLLEMVNGVAIITIKGALIEGSAGWWGRYYGIVGYDDIRNATVCAVNAGAKQIMYHVTTPGGMVVGLGALTDFLKQVQQHVPLSFYTDSYCASGGVWLSTTTGNFKASRHAEVGSVGVIAVTSEYSKYFSEMGITKRVFKSTPLKGAGNPNEPMSEDVATEIQRGVDESAQRFIDHIAVNMGLTSAFVAENLATGQMWYSEDAMRLGLLSGITTFDQLLVDLQQKVSQNTGNAGSTQQPVYFQQDAEADMAKRTQIKASSPEEALALAASGIPVATASDSVDDEDENENPVEEQNDDEEENTPVKVEESEEASSSMLDKLVTQTTNQLVEAKVALATVKAEAAVLADKVSNLQATELLLKQVVARAIQHATVGAGGPAPSLESLLAMDSTALLAMDQSAQDTLKKRLGMGGQTTTVAFEDSDEETKKAEEAAKYVDEVLKPLSMISAPK